MKTRRQALALAGALTLTVITAVGAVAGMSRGASTKPAVAGRRLAGGTRDGRALLRAG